MELGAVIESDGFESCLELSDDASERTGRSGHVASFELLDDEKAGDALDEGKDAMSLVGAHDGVTFPVSALASVFDVFGALRMTVILRRHAINATFLCFPASTRRR